MNTQNTKKSFKLNFFDILLIVLIVLVIGAAGAFLAFTAGRSDKNHTVIEYTVLVKEIPEQVQLHVEPGQTVVDTIKLGVIGETVSYEVEKATYDAFHYDEEITVHAEYDDIYNIAFTFRTQADKTDATYMINNVQIAVGAEVHFRTPYFTGYGYVTDVTEIEAE